VQTLINWARVSGGLVSRQLLSGLDVARDYSEDWIQIRDAVQRPGLSSPEFFDPLLDTLMPALPKTYEPLHAEDGTTVVVVLQDGSRSLTWSLVRDIGSGWTVYPDTRSSISTAQVILPPDTFWKFASGSVQHQQAQNGRDSSVTSASPLGCSRLCPLFGEQISATHSLQVTRTRGSNAASIPWTGFVLGPRRQERARSPVRLILSGICEVDHAVLIIYPGGDSPEQLERPIHCHSRQLSSQQRVAVVWHRSVELRQCPWNDRMRACGPCGSMPSRTCGPSTFPAPSQMPTRCGCGWATSGSAGRIFTTTLTALLASSQSVNR
jgi:hypothetical protein